MSRNRRTFESVSHITDIRNYNNSISLTGEWNSKKFHVTHVIYAEKCPIANVQMLA